MSKTTLAIVCAIFIAGCQMKVEPGINAGIDECENCSMIIQEVDQGAVAIDNQEEIHTFCNPVCLIYETNKLKKEGILPAWKIYLFDHENKAPIYSGDAHVVQGDFRTAMGFGLLAFTSYDKAADFTNENSGEVIGWDDLRLQYETPDLEIRLNSRNSDEPEVCEAKKGNIVAVFYGNNSSSMEKLKLTGYEFELTAEPEEEVKRSFIADKPGRGFAFEESDGTVIGMFVVEGDHTSEEAEYR